MSTPRTAKKLFILAILISVGMPASGQTHSHTQEQIIKAVQSHFSTIALQHGIKNIRVELLTQVDNKKKKCDRPYNIHIKDQKNLGKISIMAQCSSPQSASFSAQTRIKIYAYTPTARSDLLAGQSIQQQDIMLAEQLLTSWNSLVLSTENALGKNIKRAVKTGQPIMQKNIQPNILIKRGQSVLIIAKTNGISISAPGIAITAGTLDETITVKNSTTGKIITARIISSNEVSPLTATEQRK
ncbi:flagellar basal body P-ring formation chaperone FlgA [Chromobacterium amazonense]|uniref:flagellar basal body P-ring formation chaperone FlgA n=1 Tax=Chromobacterium amazonense TaxID=1382803 RepID=UPI0031F63773